MSEREAYKNHRNQLNALRNDAPDLTGEWTLAGQTLEQEPPTALTRPVRRELDSEMHFKNHAAVTLQYYVV
ncbi:MAG: hypothetical protein M1813_008219 [Trichoglossum hirsutum]|nr:MAG: hypothetical protein M1813_008219 [Trichoglossum hirsutum]